MYRGYIEGSIKVTGRVVLGTLGFRAQAAEIEALCLGCLTENWPPPTCNCCRPQYDLFHQDKYALLKNLAYQFNVPVFMNRDELKKVFPPMSVAELLDSTTRAKSRK